MAIDFEAIFGVADYDPCAAAAALRPAYMRLISGASEQKITFRDRDVWFHKGDIPSMRSMLAQLESECAAKNGQPGRRFAITAGTRKA